MTVRDRQEFRNSELVLEVSSNCDPKRFDMSKYENFLDALCEDRDYQKEAIRNTLRYLLSRNYENLKDLAKENFEKNSRLQEKYGSLEEFYNHLQLSDQLSCSLDHATGTGKSYVMYGIAQIMLAEGAVDQVLILCPSTTIEAGLTDKFRNLVAEGDLKQLLPVNSSMLNPEIVNASSTIERGCICIENIHATYNNSRSAIQDSLYGKGNRTLVMNDEAHHLMSPTDRELKKWKEFLLDDKYGFKYIVNVSGTCYVKDDYFTDVIHRFSLRESIDKKFIKTIKYVVEDSSNDESVKFQKIYANHAQNKTKYNKVKPLTILVTKDIATCERLRDKLVKFLSATENISREQASRKVLIVTSAAKHQQNLQVLKTVDDPDNPVEWITSVSMLSEGWDVKNVFQIVPHEERAFNSKLLIAQVLGRGLRIPQAYLDTQPVVTVFNHDRWATNIQHLVNEVLEIERRLCSYPIDKAKDYNFEVHNIEYEREETEEVYDQEDQYQLLAKGYISYSSQSKTIEQITEYERIDSEQKDRKKTVIQLKLFEIDVVAQDVFNRLQVFDQDAGTSYSKTFTLEKIKKIINESLKRIGDSSGQVTRENRNQTLAAFGIIGRKGAKRTRFKITPKKVIELNTKAIKSSCHGVGFLRKGHTVFYDPCSAEQSEDNDKKLINDLVADLSLPRSALIKVQNSFDFKTPLNVIIAASEPERKFIQGLVDTETAKCIDGWIKSPDVGFYSIEFYWKKGTHPKQGSFNPDFFIKKGKKMFVVEIKMDGDISDENAAKLNYARDHFECLNKLVSNCHYQFNILSPNSFDSFFEHLKRNDRKPFVSLLEAALIGNLGQA